MILTKEAIIKKIKDNEINIEPFDESAIGPASIDLTLDKIIRVFEKNKKIIQINENTDCNQITKNKDITKGYVLKPGELVLGITKEKITLPSNVGAWLNSRSRFARLGLMSHITAPFIQPGVSNKQVLEIYNAGNHPIKLFPNVKICQLIFQECSGNATYSGKFKNQDFLNG
jgi:dCTP deaminase